MEAIDGGRAIHRSLVKPCRCPGDGGRDPRRPCASRMIAAAARLTSGPMSAGRASRGAGSAHGNAAAATLFGVDPGALQDRGVDGVTRGRRAPARRARSRPSSPSRRRRRGAGARAGRTRPSRTSRVSSRTRSRKAAPTACLTIRDVGELSGLEAAVTELQRSGDRRSAQQIGGVAHDLGNLLMVIDWRSQLLAGGEGNAEAVKRAVDRDCPRPRPARGSSLTRQPHGLPSRRRPVACTVVVDVNAVMTGAADLLAEDRRPAASQIEARAGSRAPGSRARRPDPDRAGDR